MRKIVLLFCLLLVTLTALARPRDCIIVHLVGGGQVVFPIEGSPQISFDGSVVAIGDERYQVTNIKKYVIGDSEEQVLEGIESSLSLKNFILEGNSLLVRLSDVHTPVRLCTIDGMNVPFNAKPNSDGLLNVPLPHEAGIIYLLSIGNETIKIRKP